MRQDLDDIFRYILTTDCSFIEIDTLIPENDYSQYYNKLFIGDKIFMVNPEQWLKLRSAVKRESVIPARRYSSGFFSTYNSVVVAYLHRFDYYLATEMLDNCIALLGGIKFLYYTILFQSYFPNKAWEYIKANKKLTFAYTIDKPYWVWRYSPKPNTVPVCVDDNDNFILPRLIDSDFVSHYGRVKGHLYYMEVP